MRHINGKTKLLGVFGYPIEHTLSPVMQNALLQHLEINAVYLPFSFAPHTISDAITAFKTFGLIGANLTIPFKETVLDYIDELDPLAEFTKSVNTIYWKNREVGGTLVGTTTDPYGAILNLKNTLGDSLKLDKDLKVAILGNGGAAKAIAYVLAEKGVNLSIVSRNRAKGEQLAKDLENKLFIKVAVSSFESFAEITPSINLIINTTPVGMYPNIEQSPLKKEQLKKHQIIYDIVYNPLHTQLLKDAREVGCQIVTGKGMLAAQGAASFAKWFQDYSSSIDVLKNAKFMNTILDTHSKAYYG